MDGTKKRYQFDYSTSPSDVRLNIERQAALLRTFIKDFQTYVVDPSSVVNERYEKRREILRKIDSLDVPDIFDALHAINGALSSKKIDSYLLLSASEAYSWLAFFKSANTNTSLSDMLATRAVASYLVSSLFTEATNPDESLTLGLLLLGLDYPASSLKTLEVHSSKMDLKRTLLIAYIQNDTKELYTVIFLRESGHTVKRLPVPLRMR